MYPHYFDLGLEINELTDFSDGLCSYISQSTVYCKFLSNKVLALEIPWAFSWGHFSCFVSLLEIHNAFYYIRTVINFVLKNIYFKTYFIQCFLNYLHW